MKTANSAIVAMTAFFGALVVSSSEAEPRFANPQITREEWKQLYDRVRKQPEAKVRRMQYQIIITASHSKYISTYVFTRPGHPAHPAVVIHDAFSGDAEHTAELAAHYAGPQLAFEAWRAEFRFNENMVFPP